MADMYRIISRLQPSHSAAWRFQAWDLSYNISRRFPESYDDRVFWVFRGLDLLRKEAIPGNRRSPELYWELAWFFHHKIGLDFDEAYPDYQRHLWTQVDGALRGAPPERWRMYREIADLRTRFSSPQELLADDAARALWAIGESIETGRPCIQVLPRVDARRQRFPLFIEIFFRNLRRLIELAIVQEYARISCSLALEHFPKRTDRQVDGARDEDLWTLLRGLARTQRLQ